MKKKLELDVDFISGEPAPKKEEFLAISEYIKASKAKQKLREHVKLYILNVMQNNLLNNGTNS